MERITNPIKQVPVGGSNPPTHLKYVKGSGKSSIGAGYAINPAMAAVSIGSKVLDYAIENKRTRENREYYEKRWEYENDKINRYNSPAAQATRLMSAGLSPHLMYANGGVQNTSSATSSAENAPQRAGNPKLGIDASIMQNMATFAEIALNQSRERLINSQKPYYDTGTQGRHLDNIYSSGTMQYRINQQKLNNYLTEAQHNYTEARRQTENATRENILSNTALTSEEKRYFIDHVLPQQLESLKNANTAQEFINSLNERSKEAQLIDKIYGNKTGWFRFLLKAFGVKGDMADIDGLIQGVEELWKLNYPE